MSAPPLPDRMRVFISYSRRDDAFAQQLLTCLEVAGFDAFLDKHDILAGEAWEARLGRLIEAADTVVFVISPDSIASQRCGWEIERATALRKRILPIVWREVDMSKVPAQLSQLNFIFFTDKPLVPALALSTLTSALRTDIDLVREHTRIGEAALRWDGRGRPHALLLRGDELASAKSWLTRQPRYAPEPTLLHHAFIKAADEDEAARTNADQVRLDELRSALDREKTAQEARAGALDRERAALRRGRIALRMASVTVAALLTGGVAWMNQDYIRERYHWYAVMKPTQPTAARERELARTAGATFTDCENGCPTMVVVPPGRFTMGTPDTEEGREGNEGPLHEVTIPKAIAVSRVEVTFAQWDQCVAVDACTKTTDRGWGRADRPVIFVSWDDAQDYVQWLSRVAGRRYRLLSEAEWEYVARGGRDDLPTIDAAVLTDIAWYKGNTTSPQPVGRKTANGFGLHDTLGNVWEWVEDCWNPSYAPKPESLRRSGGAWTTGDCERRVVRGGGWASEARNMRPGDRNVVSEGLRILDLGLRVARELSD